MARFSQGQHVVLVNDVRLGRTPATPAGVETLAGGTKGVVQKVGESGRVIVKFEGRDRPISMDESYFRAV